MALDFFRLRRGLELGSVQFLEGAGVPGASGDPSTAPVGSFYLNRSTGDAYTKITSGVGTDKWEQVASKTYVDSQVGTQISWREPVEVRDGVSATLPTQTPGNPITVDGISISDGQRVLFSAISAGNGPNVYIYDQTNGVFVEDVNNETAGDTVYVVQGTSAGRRYTYNGSAWVLTDSTTIDELSYIRSFIGKTAAGIESPTYSSINQIVQSSSLETAIGALDAAIGPDLTGNTIITASGATNTELQDLADYVEQSSKQISAVNITTVTTVDSVVATMAKWIVRVVDAGDSTNVEAIELFATHNGVTVDAADHTILRLGSNILGLTFNVTLTGGTTLNVTITSTTAVNVKVQRIAAF